MKNLKKNKTLKISEKENALIKEQAERIAELKKINADLTLVLEEYRLKENKITDTLSYANKKSAEIIAESKVKYALECERLRSYRKKWIIAAHSGALKSSYEQTEKVLRECQTEMENALASDLASGDYIAERDRLNDEPNLNYDAIIAEETAKQSLETKKQIEELSDDELDELLNQL